jgi:hypothetical protein
MTCLIIFRNVKEVAEFGALMSTFKSDVAELFASTFRRKIEVIWLFDNGLHLVVVAL